MINKKTEYEDIKLNSRIILTGFWISLILLYFCFNTFSYYTPTPSDNHLVEYKTNHILLMVMNIIKAIPVFMVIANLLIKMVAIKWINIIIGILYTIINIGIFVFEIRFFSDFYYGVMWIESTICVIIYTLITVFIIIKSIKWSKKL